MADLTILDASALIAYFADSDAHAEQAVAVLEEADELGASTITLAEILVSATGRAATRSSPAPW